MDELKCRRCGRYRLPDEMVSSFENGRMRHFCKKCWRRRRWVIAMRRDWSLLRHGQFKDFIDKGGHLLRGDERDG